jgi:hypothetical protein
MAFTSRTGNKDSPISVGWMHDDEPDNAQSLGIGQGYGPPITPELADDFQPYAVHLYRVQSMN